MNNQNSDSTSNATWFIGVSFGSTEDQTQLFLAEGRWKVKVMETHNQINSGQLLW